MKLLQGISVSILVASGLMAQTITSPALPPVTPQVATTGVVGLAQEQKAQFNVFNPGSLVSTVNTICTAVLSFVGQDGTVLKSKAVSVPPGQTANLVLDALSDLQLPVGERKELRAVYVIPGVPVPSTTSPATSTATVVAPSCTLIATLEIIDVLSEQTHLVLGGVHAVPGSAPLN